MLLQYVIKTLLSALIIVAVSEVSRRNALFGGLIASLPLVSILGMIWLYQDTKSPLKVSELSTSIFWMVLPSLFLFLCLPFLLKKAMPFYLALPLSCFATSGVYALALQVYTRLGIQV